MTKYHHIAALSLCAASAITHAEVFTDLSAFQSQLSSSYFNAFDDVTPGQIPSLSYDNGQFAYEISAVGDLNSDLFNDAGLISTNSAHDGVLISFLTDNVTAVGANFWSTDVFYLPTGSDITITLSDDTIHSFRSTGPSDFRGFTSDIAIESIFIDAPERDPLNGPFHWVSLDNLTVGTAVPTPGSLALLAFSALATQRRKRD